VAVFGEAERPDSDIRNPLPSGRGGCQLELHTSGSREAPIWENEKPIVLRDPTPYLMHLI
jgi:hypothetical protein